MTIKSFCVCVNWYNDIVANWLWIRCR